MQEKIKTWISGDLLKSDRFSGEMILFVDNKPFGFVHPEDFHKFLSEKTIRPFLPKEISEITEKMENEPFNGGMIISEDMMKRIDLSPKPTMRPTPASESLSPLKTSSFSDSSESSKKEHPRGGAKEAPIRVERNIFFPKEDKIPFPHSPEEKRKKSMKKKSKSEYKLL